MLKIPAILISISVLPALTALKIDTIRVAIKAIPKPERVIAFYGQTEKQEKRKKE